MQAPQVAPRISLMRVSPVYGVRFVTKDGEVTGSITARKLDDCSQYVFEACNYATKYVAYYYRIKAAIQHCALG